MQAVLSAIKRVFCALIEETQTLCNTFTYAYEYFVIIVEIELVHFSEFMLIVETSFECFQKFVSDGCSACHDFSECIT